MAIYPTDGWGIYEGINVSSGRAVWGPRLDAIKTAGFSLVQNYNILHGHINLVKDYINYAYSIGLKVIFNLSDSRIWLLGTYPAAYPELYADSGNAASGIAFAQYLVSQVMNLPGLWGYYVCDEGTAAQYSTFQSYSAAIQAADPVHPRLIILSASDPTNNFSYGTTQYIASCDVCGDDFYPIGRESSGDVYWKQSAMGGELGTGWLARGIQQYAGANNKGSAMVLQTTSWALYGHPGAAWPTAQQMATFAQNALGNMTPRLILWYSYFDSINVAGGAPVNQVANLAAAIAPRPRVYLFPYEGV